MIKDEKRINLKQKKKKKKIKIHTKSKTASNESLKEVEKNTIERVLLLVDVLYIVSNT
jgi:hypothetical protein